MSKVTIAKAVLAGLAISDRLTVLEVAHDDVLQKAIGDLAGSLGEVMSVVETIDLATSIVQRAAQNDDLPTVVEGVNAIKIATAELVSDQDQIMQAMLGDMSEEEKLMMALLAELGNLAKLSR